MSRAEFAVIVEFLVSSEHRAVFLDGVVENAKTSVAVEPDCLQFDVFEDSRSDRILLFELYRHSAAFDAHLKTRHFLEFDSKVAPMIDKKKIHTLYARHTS